MKRALVTFKNSGLRKFIRKHQKYAPVLFFIGGFIFDTLTLGRIDRLYDLTVLCLHMTSLSITLYLYNLADDGKWKNTFLERFEEYFPLAIQFFFGGLSSAYVVYFSRSVSLSKTASFFLILVTLLFANEVLKKRISNKYLQFGVYYFICFTFFSFMIPVFIKEMNPTIFIISGLVSLSCTLLLITFIYSKSPSTRAEIRLGKLFSIIFSIYITINVFYYFKLIPPVPLALQTGIVAHDIKVKDNTYLVTFEQKDPIIFWRDHHSKFVRNPDAPVYIYSSIFAPTALKKSIIHRWNWYDETQDTWVTLDNIKFNITGGRNEGYRGYSYKNNVKSGLWKVEVLTEEELVLGVIDFEIIIDSSQKPTRLIQKQF
ncbi:conserved hypothetical membrane protein (DUF2914) [Formosa agariphila KMM 3901]|uniref:Conserved hypothetical membrane protein (DUF2914) n=1 Tax=Formosa agariphila (strain DSM 15362 / KCTC 12365 / LMG 23005 / KMM 3901 / M-2Alg 35-1) TaxID=1347342 RepID=T2KQI7_FORAG|nr:DUF2914 domain-containing protein [Formosa agariphila]CDF80763.1 conserved hypothetical membrane protein (DUF2914) [Formosa agariphila KMM 3901]